MTSPSKFYVCPFTKALFLVMLQTIIVENKVDGVSHYND